MVSKSNLTYGLIISQSSGILSIQGILTSFIGQIFRVCDIKSVSSGTVVNLVREETTSLIIFGLQHRPEYRIYQGGKVIGQPNLATIILGDFIIGSLLDPLGAQILSSSNPKARNQWVIESPAIGIVDRQSVFEPLQTGILSIDSMIPIGSGQRELILGYRIGESTSIPF